MCGIAGIHIKDTDKGLPPKIMERLVDQLLLGIEHRGHDATGMVAVSKGGKRVLMHKEAEDASTFIKSRPSIATISDVRTVLLHTRFATQGHQSNNVNNHPVLFRTCFATHNGHINNDEELFTEYGLNRTGEVDSEIIAAMFSQYGLDKAHKALQVLEGNFAVAVIDPINAPDKLVLAKGWSSPLIFFENSQFVMWASTLEALRTAWGLSLGTPPAPKKFWELQEGGLMLIEAGKTELLSFQVKEKWKSYTSNYQWGSSTVVAPHYDSTKSRVNCKNCGCTAFWHSGDAFDGACMARPKELGGDYCRCLTFVEPVYIDVKPRTPGDEDIPDWFEECDSCYDFFPPSGLELIWEEYSMCEGCLYTNKLLADDGTVASKECKHSDCGRTCQDKEPFVHTPGTQLALVSSRECGHVNCEDICVIPKETADTLVGVKVFAEEDNIEPGIWTPKDGDTDNDVRHEAILAAVAKDTGFHVAFIGWLLFEAPLSITDNDPWLEKNRELLDTAYADTEQSFNELEALAYAARTEDAMVVH